MTISSTEIVTVSVSKQKTISRYRPEKSCCCCSGCSCFDCSDYCCYSDCFCSDCFAYFCCYCYPLKTPRFRNYIICDIGVFILYTK